MAIAKKLNEIARLSRLEEEANAEIREFLRRFGWNYTCNTPGSFWLMQKTLPDGRIVLCNEGMALEIEERL